MTYAVSTFELSSDVRQLLLESAPLSEDWAHQTCGRKSSGGMEEWAKNQPGDERHVADCAWYHGTWQYLRLFNMVAVPGWHPFFIDALGAALRRRPEANVLISAAADYGMLATLHEAIVAAKASPRVVLYDICQTPLTSAKWYAERHGLALDCVRANILTTDMPEAPFDIIVTDEFLSVVKDADKPLVVRRWRELLAPGGVVVTTAMIGGVTTPELRRAYAERARHFIHANDGMVERYQNGSHQRLIELCDRFASVHTRHMVRGEDDVRALFTGFAQVSCRRIPTPGECVNPTDSVQIVATA